ncbi:MAG TPA: hypothetical protein VGM39_18795 [Kofleriaceae bacterium]|jgi:hypothetical protein
MRDTILVAFGVVTLLLGYWSVVIRAPSRLASVLAQVTLAGGVAAAVKSRLLVDQTFGATTGSLSSAKASALTNGIQAAMLWVLAAFGALVLAAVILTITRIRNRDSDDRVPPARVRG